MSIKLLISFGELGYGYVRKVSKVDVPASWKNSKTVLDIIAFVCEDYNKNKPVEPPTTAASVADSRRVLAAADVYLASSSGRIMNPDDPCGNLEPGEYFIKMVVKRPYALHHSKFRCI